jgi:hypothetical protein
MGFQELPLETHLGILSFLHSRHDLAKWRYICASTNRSLETFRDNLNKRYCYERDASRTVHSTPDLFRWWLQMEHRNDVSALKAGLEFFYTCRPCLDSEAEANSEQKAYDKGNAWAVIVILREYVGGECFTANFRKALEEKEAWPVDVSGCIPSNRRAEALSLEQAAVQQLESRGFFVDPSIKKEWSLRHAENLAAIARDSSRVCGC